MAIEQLVSVADVIIRDATTKAGLVLGKANISSALKIAMANADVRGGIGNKLLFKYFHTKELSVDIEQAQFGESFLALNSGVSVVTGAAEVVQTDCLVTSASSCAQITLTPIGNVTCFLPDGSIQTVTPSTKDLVLTGAASVKITAVYATSKTVDLTTVEAGTPPKIVDLVLKAEIRDQATSGVKKYLQIHIPSFQLSGTYDLALSANGVSTEKLSGTALGVESASCSTEDYYGTFAYIPVSSATVYTSIAATPSTIAWTKLTAQSSQISVLGIKGGVYDNANITTSCTYARSGSSASGIVVGAATGLITASASSIPIAETAVIACTYASGSLVDYVNINIT
jgi:hypothetical protein